jgi:uncharacterized membrane protein YbhN (UPF0104 family)
VKRLQRFFLHTRTGRIALAAPVVAGLVALAWWRGPNLDGVATAFRYVRWEWVAAAILINLISVAFRSIAWGIVLQEALPQTRLRKRSIFAAFCVGLLGNAALPGRVGELARVGVLSRRARRPGAWATIAGTVFAHRMFDVVCSVALVVYTLYAARLPDWAVPGLAVVMGIGLGLLLAGLLMSRRHHPAVDERHGLVRRILTFARRGLVVLRRPGPAFAALFFQFLGWTAQLFAVWATMAAFNIDGSPGAAALVLVLMNLATVFPLWPGHIGLVQAAVALPLLSYGITYPHGIAFGFGLQAIEASVGLGLGALFLAREGFTFAMLKRMPDVTEAEIDERVERIA